MGLDKRKRCAIGLGVLAIGALVADRVLLLPGPASASAGEIPLDAIAGEPVDLDDLKALASNLADVCIQEPPTHMEASRTQPPLDPFESPWLTVTKTGSDALQNPDTPSVNQPMIELPILSAVVSAGEQGYAVLDGKPLAVGASRNGYTLTALTDQAATISINGSVFTLPLRNINSSP